MYKLLNGVYELIALEFSQVVKTVIQTSFNILYAFDMCTIHTSALYSHYGTLNIKMFFVL